MARLAGLWERRGNVVGNVAAEGLRAGPVRCMARVASRVCRSEIVIIVGVTRCAGRGRMYAGERPAGGGVIEGVVGPGDRVVAGGAVCGGESATRR